MMMLASARRVATVQPRHTNLLQAPFRLRSTATSFRRGAHAHRRSEHSSLPPLTATLSKPNAGGIRQYSALAPVKHSIHTKGTPVLVAPKLDGETPILDIYDYCAGFGIVPEVSFREGTDAPENGKGTLGQYTVKVVEHGIDVISKPNARRVDALMEAASKFEKVKDAIAKAASQRMLKTRSPSTTPKPLSRHSVYAMELFLRNRHGLTYSFCDDRHDGRVNSVSITYQLNDEPQRRLPLVSSTSKAEAKVTAILRMVMSICKQHPHLLANFRAEFPKDEFSRRSLKSLASTTAVASKPLESASKPLVFSAKSLDIAHESHTLMQSVPDIRLDIERTSAMVRQGRQRRREWSDLTPPKKLDHADRLLQAYQRYNHEIPRQILKVREGLPVTAYRRQLIDLVDNNVYSIFIGATGSGKTTQVPHIIFEEWCRRGQGADCNIICTQPRVIAATSVAARVAEEVGPSLRDRVGFHVRDRVNVPSPRDGSISFVTAGILLQQIQHEPDYIFDNVSHLILDEVHERDMILDLTMTILKRAITDRLARGLKVPRILLMSATLDEEAFRSHFQNVGPDGQLINAPSLSVPGRTFPVKEKYLEDVLKDMYNTLSPPEHIFQPQDRKAVLKYIKEELDFMTSSSEPPTTPRPDTAMEQVKDDDSTDDIDWEKLDEAATPIPLIADTIAHVLRTTSVGAVLVFVPGIAEIRKVEETLIRYRPFGVDITDSNRYRLFQLHSSLRESQQSVFQPVPDGVRKVILSSPIAETSVTIPDITCVIDSGQVRETQYDNASRASWLRNSWIQASSAKQRAGRAGRVQSGTYLAMYSRARRENMPASAVPELLRSDLQSTCLSVKAKFRDVDVPEFLASALTAPLESNVKEAMQSLVDIGALTADHNLTSLGYLLSRISVQPSLAKMILMGIIFKCLDPILVIGAALLENDLWHGHRENEVQVQASKLRFSDGSQSDLIATHNAYRYISEHLEPSRDGRQLAVDEHFSWPSYQRMKKTIKLMMTDLKSTGFLPPASTVEEFADQRMGGTALNMNSHKYHIIKAVITAGLSSNIAGHIKIHKNGRYYLGDRPSATFTQSCLFLPSKSRPHSSEVLTFGQLEATKSGYKMRHVSTASPLSLALFSSHLTTDDIRKTPTFLVNKFLPMPVAVWGAEAAGTHAEAHVAPTKKDGWAVVRNFRKTLDKALEVKFEEMAGVHGAIISKQMHEDAEHFIDRVVHVLDSERLNAAKVEERKKKAKEQAKLEEQARQRQDKANRERARARAVSEAQKKSQDPKKRWTFAKKKKMTRERSIMTEAARRAMAELRASTGEPSRTGARGTWDVAASTVKETMTPSATNTAPQAPSRAPSMVGEASPNTEKPAVPSSKQNGSQWVNFLANKKQAVE